MSFNPSKHLKKAMIFQADGKFKAALRETNLLLTYFPTHPDINYLQATIYTALKQYNKSTPHFIMALNTKSNDPKCLSDFGEALRNMSQFIEAISYFEAAHKLAPKSPEILISISRCYTALGDFLTSERFIDRSIDLNPTNSSYRLLLGNVLKKAKKYEKAIESYERAISLEPNYYQAYFNLALALKESNYFREALESCKKALLINPNYYLALSLSGQLCESIGEIDNARNYYNLCISCSPTSTAPFWNIANLDSTEFSNEDVNKMKSLVGTNLSDESKTYLLFSLAKAMEQNKRYTDSFGYLASANKIKNQSLHSLKDNSIPLIEDMLRIFQKEMNNNASLLPDKTSRPIFIVGMPRSGTSLIEQILASHTEINACGELETSLNLLFEHLPKLTGLDWQLSLSKMTSQQAQLLTNMYYKFNKDIIGERRYFTDKLPLNFAMIGFLNILFPNAKFVHIYKNSIDSCFSCYKQLFTEGQEYSYSLKKLARYYNAYYEIMQFWSKSVVLDIYHINYKNLVMSPKVEIESLLGFLNLPWQQSCLNFQNTKNIVKTASAGQVRKKIYSSSIDRWKNYEVELSPLIDDLLITNPHFDNKGKR